MCANLILISRITKAKTHRASHENRDILCVTAESFAVSKAKQTNAATDTTQRDATRRDACLDECITLVASYNNLLVNMIY